MPRLFAIIHITFSALNWTVDITITLRINLCFCLLAYLLTYWLSQAENCTLEKADILELTVSQLRRMVTSTEMQCSYGYSACVREVDAFLLGIRYDETTRRRIVQHLCRRRPSVICPRPPPTTTLAAAPRVPADAESTTSGENEHCLGVFADSTTDGANEPCEAGTTATVVVNSGGDVSCKSEVDETTNSVVMVNSVAKTNDVVPTVVDVTAYAMDTNNAAEIGSIHDDDLLSTVWRPW